MKNHVAIHGLAVLALVLQGGCSSPAIAPRASIAHTDPRALDQAALSAWRAGDTGTALILLQRAIVLAPQDARLREDLQAMEQSMRKGTPIRIEPVALPAATTGDAPPPAATATTNQPATSGIPLWPQR